MFTSMEVLERTAMLTVHERMCKGAKQNRKKEHKEQRVNSKNGGGFSQNDGTE